MTLAERQKENQGEIQPPAFQKKIEIGLKNLGYPEKEANQIARQFSIFLEGGFGGWLEEVRELQEALMIRFRQLRFNAKSNEIKISLSREKWSLRALPAVRVVSSSRLETCVIEEEEEELGRLPGTRLVLEDSYGCRVIISKFKDRLYGVMSLVVKI